MATIQEPCESCGYKNPIRRTFRQVWTCNACDGDSLSRHVLTDGAGEQIAFSDDLIGKFSPAIGEVIRSKRHFAEVLHREGLIQKGTSVNTKDKRLRR